MTDPISEFLAKRKESREKKPENRTQEQINDEFHPTTWLANAARRAKRLTRVTHPAKFSHPGADSSAIIADKSYLPDGFLRTGNVLNVPGDAFGNAGALDVYAFLTIELSDGRSVLDHLRDNTSEIKDCFGVTDDEFGRLREGFLAIELDAESVRTDSKIKQVFFPVGSTNNEQDYHLLSILTPSGLVYLHRERLRNAKFSDETKQAKELRRNGQHSESGYDDFPNLLTMHFGGSQPQNVSRLNSSNSGEAWLLPCLPPSLASEYLRTPKRDFFLELSWDDELKSYVDAIHRIFVTDYNNQSIREARKYWYTRIFDWVFERAFIFQTLEPGWSHGETCHLPAAQKYWLDPESYPNQVDVVDWRAQIIESIISWVSVTYRKMYSKRSDTATLGEVEETRFAMELREYNRDNQGGLL